MKTILLPLFILIASCQSYPAHADTALSDGATPAVEAAQAAAKDIPGHMDRIDAVPVPPAAKAAIAPETAATRKDASEIDKQLAVAQSKLEDAQKFQDAQAAIIASLKDAENSTTKQYLRWLAVAVILSGAGGAYMLGQGGSIIRAGAAGGTGLILGLGLFAAAAYLTLIFEIMGWTVAIAAVVGLVAAIIHYRKHGGIAQAETDAKDELIAGLGCLAKSPSMGPIGVINLTDPNALLHLEGSLSDEALKLLAKLK